MSDTQQWPGQEVSATAWPGQEIKPAAPGVGFGQSFVQGVGDVVQGGAQLLTHALPSGVVGAVNDATAWVNRQPVIGPATQALGIVPATPAQLDEQTKQRETDYQAERGDAGLDWGRMAGNVVGGLPAAALVPAGGGLAGAVAGGAAMGAGSAATQPVTEGDYWGAKRNQLMEGGLAGAVTGPVGFVAGRAIAPQIAPNVRTLADAGTKMTPGQIIGGGTQRVEDALTSLPMVGDMVRSAQRTSLESFNRAAVNRALEPIGETVGAATTAGHDLVEEMTTKISKAYDTAIAKAKPFGPDQAFADDIKTVGQQFLTPETAASFEKAIRDKVMSRFDGSNTINGETYQTVKSELSRLTSRYSGSPSAADRELGDAFLGVQKSLQGLLARTNPQIAEELAAADRAYANSVRVSGAASRVGATEGVFTAPQLSSAVRGADKSLRHNAYARGNALMQDLSDAGRDVLPSKVPDSGTPTRIALNAGALGAGATGAAAGLLSPWVIAGGAGLAGAYSPMGQAVIRAALLARRPDLVNRLGRGLAGSGGLLGSVAAQGKDD